MPFHKKGNLRKKTVQDVERFWRIVEELDNSFLLFLKDNLVGAVLIVFAFFWIPASCLISSVRENRCSVFQII